MKKTFAENKLRFLEVRLILSDIFEEVNSIGDIDNILRPFGYKLTATHHFNSHSSSWVDLLYEIK